MNFPADYSTKNI